VKVGDLVQDEFGTIGVVVTLDTNHHHNLVQVVLPEGTGYGEVLPWIIGNNLEVINESR